MSRECVEQEFEMLDSFYSAEQLQKEMSDGCPVGGTFRAQVRIPESGLRLQVGENRHELRFLPRLVLQFQLGDGYPESATPRFRLSCSWLSVSQLVAIGNRLRELAAERAGEPVLWFWFEFLERELWHFLELGPELSFHGWAGEPGESVREESGFSIEQLIRTANQVEQEIVAVDTFERLLEFRRAFHECPVCAASKPGSSCVKFRPCGHVFCDSCVASTFRALLEADRPDRFGCLQCSGDGQTHVDQATVRRLLSPAEFSSYERRLLELSLKRMPDVQLCPRCDVSVVTEDRRRSRLGRCAHCYYSFCLACRQQYHGEQCRGPTALLKAAAAAANASEQAPAASGGLKEALNNLTATYEINDANLETVDFDQAKACPGCWTYIEKNQGCNHMHCWECKTHFCWLCMSVLDSHDPYRHFSKKNDCTGRLFDGAFVENNEQVADVSDGEDDI